MPSDVGKLAAISRPRAHSPELPARPCGYHALGGDATFVANDCVCELGARSPRSEGAYHRAKIAVMLDGAFHIRSQHGGVVVGPGALALGNRGAGYELRHLDDGGDRSVCFEYEPAIFDELGPAGFRHPCVPASAASAHAVTLTHEALCTRDPEAVREAALAVAAVAIAAARDESLPAAAPPSQSRRIAQVLRYIAAHHADDCSLATLAAQSRLSSFHFLRTFRAVTGQTPRQVVIATRLRAAAALLRTTRRPVMHIALDVGFGDLSHFMASFARAFGVSPGGYRASQR